MEQTLGRMLERGEVVHHINRDRSDNRPENLELVASNSAHRTKHSTDKNPLMALLRDREWLAARISEGMSDERIAAELGCTQVAVFKWRHKYGLATCGRINQWG